MKKTIFTSLCAIALLLGMNSCLDSGDDTETIIMTMYNRALHIGSETDPVFSAANAQLNVRESRNDHSVNIFMLARLDNGQNVSFETGYIPLVPTAKIGVYTVSCGTIQQNGHTISSLSGTIDFNNAAEIHYMVDGQYQVFSTSMPYYRFSRMTVESGGSTTFTTDKVALAFEVISTETSKAVLHIYNFALSTSESPAYVVDYEDLDLTLTATGYEMHGHDITPRRFPDYGENSTPDITLKATDVDVIVNAQGQVISGTLVLDDNKTVFISGNMFN